MSRLNERLPGEGGRRSVSKCKVSASFGRPCEGGLHGRWGKARQYEAGFVGGKT